MFPDDTLHAMLGAWWAAERGDALTRGRLVYAYVHHADAHPFLLVAEGRKEPSDPSKARMRLVPFHADAPPKPPSPPTPALPFEEGEAWAVRRVRRRACLVLGVTGPAIYRPMRTAARETPVGPAILVAPYYDASTLDPGFVDRVRRAEYPHCVWDRLPLGAQRDVILRLDQVQAVGRDPLGVEWTDHALTPAALAVVDAWFHWNLTGALMPGDLHDFRELVRGA